MSPVTQLHHWSPPCSLWAQKQKRAKLAPSDPSDGKEQARRGLSSRDSCQNLWFCRWSTMVNIPHIHWPCQPPAVRFLLSLCSAPDVHTRQRTAPRTVGTMSTAAEESAKRPRPCRSPALRPRCAPAVPLPLEALAGSEPPGATSHLRVGVVEGKLEDLLVLGRFDLRQERRSLHPDARLRIL